MTVSVRNAAAGDADAIAVLMAQLGYPATGQEIGQRLRYWLPDQASQILLAVDGDRVLGCLSLHAVPYLERTGRLARITSFVIDSGARGTGIGRALVDAAEALARQWGCLTMEVTSARNRPDAHAFYQHMGYTDSCGRSGRFLKPLG